MVFLEKPFGNLLKSNKTKEKLSKTFENDRRVFYMPLQNEMKDNEVIYMAKNNLKAQAEEIKRLAEERGVQSNFFFVTTFERYQVQLDILDALKTEIEENGLTVKKEYVKGRSNVYSNPCVSDFNRTTDSANKTVATLMRIIKNFGFDEEKEESDPLMEIINGGDDDN